MKPFEDDPTIKALLQRRVYHVAKMQEIDRMISDIYRVLTGAPLDFAVPLSHPSARVPTPDDEPIERTVTVTRPDILRRYGWNVEPLPKSVSATRELWEMWRKMPPQSVLFAKSSSLRMGTMADYALQHEKGYVNLFRLSDGRLTPSITYSTRNEAEKNTNATSFVQTIEIDVSVPRISPR